MEREYRATLLDAIMQFGLEHRKTMAIEECAELINALAKERRGRKNDVITEIADVQIMIDQLKLIYGEEKVKNEIDRKVARLQTLLMGINDGI